MCKSFLKSLPAAALLFGLGTSAGFSQGAGQAMVLRYLNITGGEVRQLLEATAQFPNAPDLVYYVTGGLVTPTAAADTYGQMMNGFIVPTTTGWYRLAVSGDDQTALWLSTDANPANLKPSCWTRGSSGVNNYRNASHPQQQSEPVYLEAGKHYYFEALHKEGTGGDGFRVGWVALSSETDPALVANSTQIPSANVTTAINPGVAAFYQEPVTTTIEESGEAVFEALFDGDAPFDYEWIVDGVGRGSQRTYSRRAVLSLSGQTVFDGTTVSVVLTNALGIAVSSNAVLSIVMDTTPPAIDEVIGTEAAPTSLLLRFSEAVNPASFGEFDISFTDGITTVASITADPTDASRYTVMTSGPVADGTTMTLTFVQDPAGNAANNLTKKVIINEGTIRRQVYRGTPDGGEVRFLLSNPTFPYFPTDVLFPPDFSTPSAYGDQYGQRIQGYIRVGKTGAYRVAVATDDESVVYLSPDDNPAHKRRIMGVSHYSGVLNYYRTRMQQTVVNLTEGVKHYVEVLHKEGTGGDHLGFAMVEFFPLTAAEAITRQFDGPIPSNTPVLSGLYLNPYREAITIDPAYPMDIAAGECSPAQIFEVRFLTGSPAPFAFQWYNGDNDTPIAGATSATLSIPAPLTNGTFYCVIANDVNTVTSRTAVLTVPITVGGPRLIAASAFDESTQVTVTFDRVLEATSSTDAFNYSVVDPVSGAPLAGVVVVTNALDAPVPLRDLGLAGTRFVLEMGTPVTPPFKVKVVNLLDCRGRPLEPGGDEFLVERWGHKSMNIGLELNTANQPGTNYPVTAGDVDVRISGADIWGTGDQFNFIYELVTGDFDRKVHTPSIQRVNEWVKTGLMVRENLTPGSRMLYAVTADFTTEGNAQLALGRRDSQDASAAGWPTDPRPGVPRGLSWVRFKREGNTFTAYVGTNGVNWQLVSSHTPAWGGVENGPLHVGICTTSHNTGANTTAEYREYGELDTVFDPASPMDITVSGECAPPQTLRVVLIQGAVTSSQWYDAASDTPIAGATGLTLTLPPPLASGTYYCVLNTGTSTVTSRTAVVTVPAYTTGPRIAAASAFDESIQVTVTFDRLVNPAQGGDAFNYSVVDTVSGLPLAAVLTATNLVDAPSPLGDLTDGGTRYALQLATPVTPPFIVKVVNITDCQGRTLDPTGSEYRVEPWGHKSVNIGLELAANQPGTNFPINVGNVDVRISGADIWGTGDQFNFIYRMIPGDFDLKVHTPSIELVNNWVKTGLMVRENLTPGSRMLYAVTSDYTTPGFAQLALGRRDSQDASAAGWPTDPRPGVARELSWVRLKRVGTTFTAYLSTNGVYWQQVSTYTPAWGGVEAGPLYVGLCTTSHNTAANTTAEYRNYGDFSYPGAAINIVQQPANVTTPQGTRATFTVVAEVMNAPTAELTYQWQKADGLGGYTDIIGANTAAFQTGFLTVANDHGAIYRVVLKLPGLTVNSTDALLTVEADTVAPRLRYAVGLNATSIAAVFDEPMDPTTAADPSRWSIDNGAAITAGLINAGNPTRVDLTVDAAAPLVPGTLYTLTAGTGNGPVTDVAGNATDPNPATAQFVGVTDFLAGWVNPQMAAIDTVTVLPTVNKLPFGALTDRGFNCRMVQITNIYANEMNVVEQVLAGTFLVGAWPFEQPQGPNVAGEPEFVETGVINYNVLASPLGRIQPDKPFPGIPNPAYPAGGPGDTNYVTMEALAYLRLNKGLYRLGVNSDDGFRVTPATNATDEANAIVLGQFNGGRGSSDSTFDIQVPEDGLYPIRLVWEQGTGGCNVEFWTFNLQTGEYLGVNDDAGVWAYRAGGGTGPTPPDLGVSLVGSDVVICFPDPGCATCTYTLQSKDDLTAPSWTDEAAAPVMGGGTVCFTVRADQAARFYRVRITP